MSRLGPVAGPLVAIPLLHGALVLPSRPEGLRAATLLSLPIELPIAVLLILALRGPAVRAAVVALAAALTALRLADLGTFQAFGRPFNPALDLHLLASGWSLLRGSVGRAQALVAAAVALGGLAALAALLWASLGALSRLSGPWRAGVATACALALAAGSAPGTGGLVTADLVPGLRERVARMARATADLRAFAAALPDDPVGEPRFAALEGRDVIVLFVESYGRSFVEAPRFTPVSAPRLAAVEARLAAAGWHASSAWAASPIRGGQSWLAHGTALSGLWVDDQARYDRLIASERRSLNRLFSAAGWRTGAAMPAITLDWPEAAWFGYDVTLDAQGLGYRGEPFEWVTMPDQYTLSAMHRMLRGGPPAMIEAALITSHAPWTPLPRVLPWEAVGDGSAFDGTQRRGDAPREVWADPERVRAQYGRSLDYALEVVGQYVARHGEGALFVVLGDHQPAAMLTGPDASADVPVHVIADDPALLARLPEPFAPGLVPSGPSLRMDGLRAIVASAFEAPLASPAASSSCRHEPPCPGPTP